MQNNFSSKILLLGIPIYIITILIGYSIFGSNIMPFPWILWHFLVLLFFFGGSYYTFNILKSLSHKSFIKYLFLINIILKLIILTLTYFYFKSEIGIPMLSHKDPFFYHDAGLKIAQEFRHLNFNVVAMFPNSDFSDLGGIVYYGLIYFIFGNSVFIAGIINILFMTSAIILTFKIITQIHSEPVAKLTAIIMSFIPILNLYVGVHLKEIIFIWLIVKGSHLIISGFSKGLKFQNILSLILIIFSLFSFRTVIAFAFILSVITYFVFSENTKIRLAYKILTSAFLLLSFGFIVTYSSINKETNKYYSKGTGNNANSSIIYTLNKERGKHSITTSFLGIPEQIAICTISPFPTLINYKGDHEEIIGIRILIADAFAKGFLSLFFVFGIVNWKELKRNFFITTFLIINIAILSISGLTANYRFFLPTLPFFIYFSAVGLMSKKTTVKKVLLFFYPMILIVIYLFFNYTKLLDYNLI